MRLVFVLASLAVATACGAGTPMPEPGPTDQDGDRILDDEDACPNEAESYNGIDDDDGCPDEGELVVEDGMGHGTPLFVRFPTSSATMPEDAAPILDAVAAYLSGTPEIERAAVVGRAAPDEPAPRNLSLARAEAVQRLLEQRGIDRARLESIGLSTNQPLTEGEAFDPRAERSVGFEVLMAAGIELLRFDGQRLVPPDHVRDSDVVVVDNIDVIFDQVYFARDSAEIRAVSAPIVEALAHGMALRPRLERMACIGHAARREADPDAIAQARADAVCEALIAHGVDPARLESHGVGTRMPTSGPPTGRPYEAERERRVELSALVESGRERFRWNGSVLEAVAEPAIAE